MSGLTDFLKTIAPTVGSALLGPLGGVAVAGLGKIFGIDNATTADITRAITDSQITPEHLAEIKKLELEYQENEKERGFRYTELEFKDRDSARRYNTEGGIQVYLFFMSVMLLISCLGMEGWVLFRGYPDTIPEIIVGRVLGLADAVVMLILGYYYGSTSGSQRKNELLAVASLPGSKSS